MKRDDHSHHSSSEMDPIIPNSVLFNKTNTYGRSHQSLIQGPIDYKDIELLKRFVSEKGRILPRRLTNLTALQQRRVKEAIKIARILSLMPFAQKFW